MHCKSSVQVTDIVRACVCVRTRLAMRAHKIWALAHATQTVGRPIQPVAGSQDTPEGYSEHTQV